MNRLLLIALLFIARFSLGQTFTFTQRFSDDSLGKYGFRTSSFYISDTVKKIWLVNGKDLRGYTKKKVIEWLGKPEKIDSLKDGRVYMDYNITRNIVHMYLRLKNNKVISVSDTINEQKSNNGIDNGVTWFGRAGGDGHVGEAPPQKRTEIIVKDPVILVKIINGDTTKKEYGVDSLFDSKDVFKKYLIDHIKYPEVEKEANIMGTVYVSFVLEKDSTITNIQVLQEVKDGPGLAKEAVRVMKQVPNMPPRKENGKPIKVMYWVGIRFVID
jgi:TonB family protein